MSSSPRFLAIRDESPTAVPEPATLVQAVIGVGLVAWVRRLRTPPNFRQQCRELLLPPPQN